MGEQNWWKRFRQYGYEIDVFDKYRDAVMRYNRSALKVLGVAGALAGLASLIVMLIEGKTGAVFFAALMLANLAMLLVGCAGVRIFAKIVSLEKRMLYPIILVVSLLGAFSINKNVFDIGVCVLFGVIGWLMNKYEFPLSPILLALILGPMCEQNFVRFMDLNQGNFAEIIHYPIAVGFFVVAVGVIIFSLFNQRKINKREAEALAAAGLKEQNFAQE